MQLEEEMEMEDRTAENLDWGLNGGSFVGG
jgi:hypothetical protein